MAPAAVTAEGLALSYWGEPVLEHLDFEAPAGTALCVLGPNGGGKTTLFRALMGELRPVAGRVAVDGRPAYLAQTERTRLDFPVTALDVALMGSLAGGRWWRPPGRAAREAAAAALDRVGLGGQPDVIFGQLSGGQRRRVLLARALTQDAAVLLLDEPFAGVDPVSAERIAAVFAELQAEGRTLLISTHDVESARSFDLVLCLNRRQVAFGDPARALDREVLEATYGGDIVVLEARGDHVVRAITVQHHEH